MKSLQKLCEISLMRNYLQLQDVENVPYRLIKNILAKVRREHLCKLEASNALLVFDDDELWLNFLKQEFPTSIHDCYVSKKDIIKEYYICYIKENDPKLLHNEEELVELHLRSSIRKDISTNKYKMPYRLLYFKYQQDAEQKQEKSAERLRLQIKLLEQERQKNQAVMVDHSFYAQNQAKKFARNSPKSNHSDLFRKSIKDHGNRLQHFKSGGFDILKRRTTRVAFGGAAGNVPEHMRLSPKRPPEELKAVGASPTIPLRPQSPPKPIKRRSEPPSIFLTKKRPSLAANKEKSTRTSTLTMTQQRSAYEEKRPAIKLPSLVTGHKKRSTLFSSPTSFKKTDDQQLNGNVSEANRSSKSNIYIFDRTKSQDAS